MKNRIIKLAALVLLCTMLMCLCSCSKKKDLLKTVKDNGYVVIATEGDWSPWTYHDEDGTLTGYDVEVGKALAAKLGVEARFEETAWDSILAGVDSGRFDIACNGVTYTEERAQKYNFSDPYLYTQTVLMVRGDNTDIKSFDDLEGKVTANSVGSIYADVAAEYGAEVKNVDTLGETLELLLQGRIDATVNAKVSYQDYMEEHPDADIIVVDQAESEISVFPVRKAEETESFVEAVNKALQELRDDGTLAELSIRFFGADLTNDEA